MLKRAQSLLCKLLHLFPCSPCLPMLFKRSVCLKHCRVSLQNSEIACNSLAFACCHCLFPKLFPSFSILRGPALDVGPCCLSECDLGNIAVMSLLRSRGVGAWKMGVIKTGRPSCEKVMTETNRMAKDRWQCWQNCMDMDEDERTLSVCSEQTESNYLCTKKCIWNGKWDMYYTSILQFALLSSLQKLFIARATLPFHSQPPNPMSFSLCTQPLTLKVPVTAIDALRHFETG